MSTFPRLLTGADVERAVTALCLRWGETWIAQVEREREIPPRSLPVPNAGSFTTVSEDFVQWPEDRLPAVLVLSPGLTGPPRRENDRTFTAPVGLALGILADSPAKGMGREIAHLLAAAYTEVLLQHELEIETDGVYYIDERYGDIAREDERTLGAARIIFTIHVRNWRSNRGGPINIAEPPAEPYMPPGDRPRAERINVIARQEGEA